MTVSATVAEGIPAVSWVTIVQGGRGVLCAEMTWCPIEKLNRLFARNSFN